MILEIVSADSIEELNKKSKELASEGFEPSGGITINDASLAEEWSCHLVMFKRHSETTGASEKSLNPKKACHRR